MVQISVECVVSATEINMRATCENMDNYARKGLFTLTVEDPIT